MALDSHIQKLELRHKELETTLAEVLAHPSADDKEIAEIKRQKLLIKDRIRNLSSGDTAH